MTVQMLLALAASADDHYLPGRLRKPTGWRTIDMPSEQLKEVQRHLMRAYLVPLQRSRIAYGVGPGRTHIDAARLHERQPWVVVADIENFFPSISSVRVLDLLVGLGCKHDVARVLADLTTHMGSLPQGAPSSPVLANLLLARLDHRLDAVATALGVQSCRYVDDFGFSGDNLGNIRQLTDGVLLEELMALGLRLKPDKTKEQARSAQQIMFGLTLNNGVAVPKPERKKLKCRVHVASRRGCTEKEREKLRGEIEYVGLLHPGLGRELTRVLAKAPGL